MERFWISIGYIFALIVGWFAGLHNVFWGLLILQGLDIFTGMLISMRTKTFRSAIGKAGIQRRIATWALILAVGTFSHFTGLMAAPPEAGGMGVAEWAAAGMAAVEVMSIAENAKILGVSIPSWLLAAMEKTKTLLGLAPREPGDNGK